MNIFAERKPWNNGITFHMGEKVEGGAMAVAQPLTFAQVSPGEISSPFMSLDFTDSQQFMDALWSCGIRPSEGSGSAGSLAATERHLADMKKIAFHALKVAP